MADVQEAVEDTTRLSHLHGSAMFFLTQEAGMTLSLLVLFSALYHVTITETGNSWDMGGFAELHMFHTINNVLDKFLVSEKEDAHLFDPSILHNSCSVGNKVAIHHKQHLLSTSMHSLPNCDIYTF